MSPQQTALKQALANRTLVKVIAGINNMDLDRVAMVVRAAQAAGAGAVDVAAHSDVVVHARALTQLPVFASSVNPQALAEAVAHGADAVELGNFDALYEAGFYISAEEVLRLTKETLALVPQGTPFSVTIPGHLSLTAQVQLARQLEALGGVTLIQTEGASPVVTLDKTLAPVSAETKLARTLAHTEALVAAVSLPVMTASGISAENATQAFAAGAAAVGVGRAVNALATQAEMEAAISRLVAAVTAQKPVVAASQTA